MAIARRGAPARSGPIGWFGLAVIGALLTGFFVFLGFPYDRLGERVLARLGQATGTEVSFQELGPFFSFAGPGFEVRALQVTTLGGERLQLERARMRPAWSTAWLQLTPAVHVDLVGPGRMVGVLTLGDAPGFRGELEEVDLARLPMAGVWPGASLQGTLDAVLDLRSAAAGLEGFVALEARDGQLDAPDVLPVLLPFTTLTGTLRLGDGGALAVEELEIQSKLLTARASGSIQPAASPLDSALDLRVDLENAAHLRPVLEGAGIRPSADGNARLHVGGTPADPELR